MKRKLIILACLILGSGVVFGLVWKLNGDQTSGHEKKIRTLLSNMSLEEKIGQMTQLDMNMIAKDGYENKDGSLDKEKLKEAISNYHIGSFINPVGHAYSAATWHKIITGIQEEAMKGPNKIPVIYGIDAVHGGTYTLESTLFPHNLGMAATRNTELAKEAAKVTAREVRASGIRWNFSPVLDAGRQPLWSRYAETWGEDVYIAKEMGVASIRGMEEDGLKSFGAVASCMKHFIGYSAPNSGKDRTPAHIPEIILREYYLPQFKAAIEAGASTIMINSGEINGIPTHANHYLLKQVLRKELGFTGLVVSDWEDIIRLHTRHKIAASPKEAVKIAVNAGIDMSMVPNDFSFHTYLVELVKEGAVSMETIDAAVGRILKLKFDVGLFDNPFPEKKALAYLAMPKYKATALQAARESVTLLKNDTLESMSVLPLLRNTKVLLTGPAADNVTCLHGCWSYTWQGKDKSYYPSTTKTVKAAIEEKIGKEHVQFVASPGFENNGDFNEELFRRKAKTVDYILLCLGEDAYAESPGAIDDLTLSESQLNLAEVAASTGKPVILILVQGRPRVISSIVEEMNGILLAYWPGAKGAEAIVDVLFGDYNPDGKLPFTYPKATGDIVLYDHKFSEKVSENLEGINENGFRPQWEFGHGLSYTTFDYGDIHVSQKEFSRTEKVRVTVPVKNIGGMDGKHTVELYSRDLFASVTPDNKRLRKFKKVFVPAGETINVEFDIDRSDLAFVNKDFQTVTEPGEFELTAGVQKILVNYK